ncbi:MAG: 16S rRNA (adenine(1518)-N(6)/adenine(1519)-N(6)) -dimethyltransferase RsmA [Candidatus Dormibacteria bacterium]
MRAVARRCGLVAKRRLGQNFLVDRDVLEQIVAELAPAGAAVMEVGPGIGTLTVALAAAAAEVIAVELDPDCVRACEITLRGLTNVRVLLADVLRVGPAELGLRPGYLVAGNIPYNLTGALLHHLLEGTLPPRRAVLLVQREVARRLSGDAGEWGLSTVAVRSLATVERLRDIPPAAFEPAPAVHSSLIRVTPAPALDPGDRSAVLELARAAFGMRRKTLRHGISAALGGDAAARMVLGRAAIDSGRRPGTLDLEEWRALAAAATDYRRSQ